MALEELSSIACSEAQQEKIVSHVAKGFSKPTPTVAHSLCQGHTYSYKATPLNSVTSWAKAYSNHYT